MSCLGLDQLSLHSFVYCSLGNTVGKVDFFPFFVKGHYLENSHTLICVLVNMSVQTPSLPTLMLKNEKKHEDLLLVLETKLS